MKEKLSAVIPVVLGLIGAALNSLAQNSAFEPGTDLVIPGAKTLTALTVFYIISFLFACGAAFTLRGHKAEPENMYHTGAYGLVLGIFAALCTCAGSVLWLLRAPQQRLILAVIAVLAVAGIGMFWLALRGSGTCGSTSVWEQLPCLGSCLWLIVFYQNNARDPEIAHYCWFLLGMMALTLALYLQARCVFGGGSPGRTLLLTTCAVVFCIAALPAAESGSDILLSVGLTLWLLRRWPCLFRTKTDAYFLSAARKANEANEADK